MIFIVGKESRMELFSSAWCRAADEPFPGKTIVYRVPIQKEMDGIYNIRGRDTLDECLWHISQWNLSWKILQIL